MSELFGKHHVVLVSVVDCLISAFVVSHRGFASDGAVNELYSDTLIKRLCCGRKHKNVSECVWTVDCLKMLRKENSASAKNTLAVRRLPLSGR